MKSTLESELARAEAVVASDNGEYKRHTPTIDNHRGQVMALKKALFLLEMEKIYPPGPLKITRDYRVTISWRVLILIVALAIIIIT